MESPQCLLHLGSGSPENFAAVLRLGRVKTMPFPFRKSIFCSACVPRSYSHFNCILILNYDNFTGSLCEFASDRFAFLFVVRCQIESVPLNFCQFVAVILVESKFCKKTFRLGNIPAIWRVVVMKEIASKNFFSSCRQFSSHRCRMPSD